MAGATTRGGGTGVEPGSSRRRAAAAPVLVRQVRNGFVESEHRGSIVEADASGRILHLLGDADRLANLRSAVKPFGAVAFVEAGGLAAFGVTQAELAIMTASHSGEDLHVRTLQELLRRAKIPQSALGTGTDGMPLDALTAARLARDGERPSQLRHMCSGQHTLFLLMSKQHGWPLDAYWREDHPSQAALRSAVARTFGVAPDRMVTGTDACGIPTFAFPLATIARAYAFLAEPAAIPASDPRAEVAEALATVRDAMVAHPELVAGTRDRLDTSLMKGVAGIVAKGGAEALQGVGIVRKGNGKGGETGRPTATGLAVKIDDGDAAGRAMRVATVEALAQIGALDAQALRMLSRYHRVPSTDPRGRVVAEASADFELAPVGELA